MVITPATFRPEYQPKTEPQSRTTDPPSRVEMVQMLFRATWKVKAKPINFIPKQPQWPNYISRNFQLDTRYKTR